MNKLQNFVIWLDGYLEAAGKDGLDVSKTNVIRNKLNTLFEHVVEQPTEQPLVEKPKDNNIYVKC